MRTRNKGRYYVKKPKGRQVLGLALPLVLQQLCLQMQIWIDRAMLGRVNVEFFSAIGNTTAPYLMVSSAITAICGGTAIITAQSIGARDLKRAQRTAAASFLGSSIMSGAVFLLFMLCAGGLFRLMGLQSPILEYSTVYIRVLAFSLLILGPASTATAVLQGIGLTKIIMLAGLVGNLLNIALDWILIFGRLGLPAMGIKGAALATVIANFLSGTLTIIFLLRSPKVPFRIGFSEPLSEQLRRYNRVLELGIPSGLEFFLWNIGNVILVSFLNRLDMMSAGIYTLVFSVETVPMLIYMGFANAGLTLVGQQTGAKEPKQARSTGLLCLAFSLLVCLAVAAVFRIIPRGILALFTDEISVVEMAVPYLVFVTWILFPKAVNNVIGLCIRGTGDTKWMLYTQIFGTLFMIVAGYYMILHTELGLMGVFVTFLLDESIRAAANLLRFFTIERRIPHHI